VNDDNSKGQMRQNLNPSVEGVFLSLILLASLALNLWNNNFPLHYHFDEAKKIHFIKESTQDFGHPLMMLQLVRMARSVFKGSDVLFLGRVISAILGTGIVLLSFLIARGILKRKYALFAAVAVAVSPIVVIHAHYLKEDIIATFFMMGALYFFLKFLRKDSRNHLILLGVATGLACSSQYKSFLLFFLYSLCPFLVPSLIKSLKKYFKKLALILIIAVVVFCLIDWPMLFDFKVLIKGVVFETKHAFHGHDIRFYPLDFLFSFHLFHSITPGITLPLTLLGLAYIVFALLRWKSLIWQERILISYVLLFYFSTELMILKPFPDFMRYMIPIVPIVLNFSCALVQKIEDSIRSGKRKYAVYLLAVALLPSLHDTILLDDNLNKDTRAILEAWIVQNKQKTIGEGYTTKNKGLYKTVISLGQIDIEEARRAGVTCMIASSFMYDRFLWGGSLKKQKPGVYKYCEQYKRIFKYPYIEIKPVFKSFAFSNPTIRIIRIAEP